MNTECWTVEDLAIVCRGRLTTCLDMILADRREAQVMYDHVVESYLLEQLRQEQLNEWAQNEDDLWALHFDELRTEWWS